MITVSTPSELLAIVGTDLGATEWFVIDQDDITAFADTTRDRQWIHVNAERAEASPFGSTIAHGMLTLSHIPPRLGELLTVSTMSFGLNYGFEKVRFLSIVPAGSRVRVTGQVLDVRDLEGGARVTFAATVEIEGQRKPACYAESIVQFMA